MTTQSEPDFSNPRTRRYGMERAHVYIQRSIDVLIKFCDKMEETTENEVHVYMQLVVATMTALKNLLQKMNVDTDAINLTSTNINWWKSSMPLEGSQSLMTRRDLVDLIQKAIVMSQNIKELYGALIPMLDNIPSQQLKHQQFPQVQVQSAVLSQPQVQQQAFVHPKIQFTTSSAQGLNVKAQPFTPRPGLNPEAKPFIPGNLFHYELPKGQLGQQGPSRTDFQTIKNNTRGPRQRLSRRKKMQEMSKIWKW